MDDEERAARIVASDWSIARLLVRLGDPVVISRALLVAEANIDLDMRTRERVAQSLASLTIAAERSEDAGRGEELVWCLLGGLQTAEC